MDLIHAKGSSFYSSGNITMMDAYTVKDVVATQQRYDLAVGRANEKYAAGEITLAARDILISDAEYEKLYLPVMQRVQSQEALDKIRVQSVGDKEEQGIINDFNCFDCEIGINNNNFVLQISKATSMMSSIELGDYIYAEGTEFGGIIDGRTVDTSTDEIIWTGTTWRGLLEKDIVRPLNPATDAFRVVSGDLNDILRTILPEGGGSGTIFSVPEINAGKSITSYKFPRYVNKLKSLKNMLASKGYRLKIWTESGGSGGQFSVKCSAVPIMNYSHDIEYSQDNKVNIKMSQDYSVCNHLICLGDGELTDRMVVDIYVDKDGKITTTKPTNGFFGVFERIDVYDYSSVEGETADEKRTNLLNAGILQLQSLNKVNDMELSVDDIEVDIGDIIAGLDRTTGVKVQRAITNKILRIDSKLNETIELNVNGMDGDEVENN